MGKLQKLLLVLIIFLSLFLHLYGLSNQEFTGDDASPMLSIDRMWDSISLKDIRFLAYPFLFYNEPYRAIFSGTILHFFGPDRITLRLPSIIFGISTLILLIWIFKKEKITPWLTIFSIASYSISAIIINNRSGGGDAQTRFLLLLAGYFIWQAKGGKYVRNFRFALIAWTIGMFTMLNAIALLPAIILVILKNKLLTNKKILPLIVLISILFCLYFAAWLALPYLAFKFGFQNHLDDRGLFYYFSRIREGIMGTPFTGIEQLIDYTSLPFTIWILVTSILAFKIKKFGLIQFISLSALAAVIVLNRSGYHIIKYAAFFLFSSVMVTDYFIKKYRLLKIFVFALVFLSLIMNGINLFTNYFSVQKSTPYLEFQDKLTCLDMAVFRIYKEHNITSPKKLCERAAINEGFYIFQSFK